MAPHDESIAFTKIRKVLNTSKKEYIITVKRHSTKITRFLGLWVTSRKEEVVIEKYRGSHCWWYLYPDGIEADGWVATFLHRIWKQEQWREDDFPK